MEAKIFGKSIGMRLKNRGRTESRRRRRSALEKCERERESGILLHCKSGITRLDPERLEFCEVIHRTLLLYLSSGKVLEATGSLDELSRRLKPSGCFLRVRRSYLVHLGCVRSISRRAVTMVQPDGDPHTQREIQRD